MVKVKIKGWVGKFTQNYFVFGTKNGGRGGSNKRAAWNKQTCWKIIKTTTKKTWRLSVKNSS